VFKFGTKATLELQTHTFMLLGVHFTYVHYTYAKNGECKCQNYFNSYIQQSRRWCVLVTKTLKQDWGSFPG